MATLLDRFKALLTKNQQSTNEAYNRAIYNYLGDTLVWNPENDDTFINKGYRYNSTVYAIVNLIRGKTTHYNSGLFTCSFFSYSCQIFRRTHGISKILQRLASGNYRLW